MHTSTQTIAGHLPDTKKNARIGILGGSFDPPHFGHQMLALVALASNELDAIWVLPCADHPLKKAQTDFGHRLQMCTRAFSHFTAVQVLDLEAHLPQPNYTVKTLEAIHAARGDLNLSLIFGTDILAEIARWHTPEQLNRFAKIEIFQREGYPVSALPKELSGATLHQEFFLPDIQSRILRSNQKIAPAFVDQRVLYYIKENGLY